MSRTLVSGVDALLTAARVNQAWLVDLILDSGSLYLWSGLGDLSANGNTYTGTGTLGSVSGIGESAEVRPSGASLKLSGVNASLLSIVLAEHLQGRTARVYHATFTADGATLQGATLVYEGSIDNPQIDTQAGFSEILLPIENRMVDLDRINEPRFLTNQDQQDVYPGDLGCEHIEVLVNKPIWWGRWQPGASPSPGVSGGGGGGGGPISNNGDPIGGGMNDPIGGGQPESTEDQGSSFDGYVDFGSPGDGFGGTGFGWTDGDGGEG